MTAPCQLTKSHSSFLGAMSIQVPWGSHGRFNVTLPLAPLRISDAKVWLGTWIPALPFVEYEKPYVSDVFRSRSLFYFGIGIDTADGKTHWFGTFRRRKVLSTLASRGYVVGTARSLKFRDMLG